MQALSIILLAFSPPSISLSLTFHLENRRTGWTLHIRALHSKCITHCTLMRRIALQIANSSPVRLSAGPLTLQPCIELTRPLEAFLLLQSLHTVYSTGTSTLCTKYSGEPSQSPVCHLLIGLQSCRHPSPPHSLHKLLIENYSPL